MALAGAGRVLRQHTRLTATCKRCGRLHCVSFFPTYGACDEVLPSTVARFTVPRTGLKLLAAGLLSSRRHRRDGDVSPRQLLGMVNRCFGVQRQPCAVQGCTPVEGATAVRETAPSACVELPEFRHVGSKNLLPKGGEERGTGRESERAREREGGRDKERERERHTHTQRDRETERQTGRETGREREREQAHGPTNA